MLIILGKVIKKHIKTFQSIKSITLGEVIAKDYSLVPSKYIEFANRDENIDYNNWVKNLKQKFQSAQIKAHIQFNSTLLEFYWNLGQEIVEKQKSFNWRSGFLEQLSKDLTSEFTEIKGFSKRDLELIRKWYLFWQQAILEIENFKTKQVVSQIFQIPWGIIL